VTRGRCYYHNFLRFSTIFCNFRWKNRRFSQKTMLWWKFWIIWHCFVSKTPKNHNIGPRWVCKLVSSMYVKTYVMAWLDMIWLWLGQFQWETATSICLYVCICFWSLSTEMQSGVRC
jgi:hypothetical protein